MILLQNHKTYTNNCESVISVPLLTLITVLDLVQFQLWSQEFKYLGVVINSKLKWNDHCQYVVSKATKCLNGLHRAMYGCTQEAIISAHKALVRPYLEYACAVWAPYTAHGNDLLESVQNRAARWIKSFWDPSALRWSKSSAICVGELG